MNKRTNLSKAKATAKPLDKKILHVLLIIAVLFLFTKLSIDAIILGAIAIFLWQTTPKRRKSLV